MVIKGIPVTLYTRTMIGKDAFGAPLFEESPVTVENVLVSPVKVQEVVNTTQLTGKCAEYELCIPKEDVRTWADCRVEFFGHRWCVIGPEKEWISALVPGPWNKKVLVAKYE